jgi:hypothetical protein
MDRIEYKEGIIYYGGSRAGTALETVVLVLSAAGSKTISETCDLLNQLIQSFDDTVVSLKEIAEEIGELLEVSQDICESCKGRRTQHGSRIKAGKPREAVANIKWHEKYRLP